MNRRFCGNGVPDWVPQPPTFNFPYPLEVEYDVDEAVVSESKTFFEFVRAALR